MNSYNGAHTESRSVWPDPLASTGVWNIGALALPGVVLSICSAAVFGIVLLFFTLGERPELFVLPFPGTLLTSVIAAAIAWTIAIRCRRRPGRLAPRVWALALACLNTTIALASVVFPNRSLVLALAVAGLAAAATLVPRLVRLRPNTAMVQWIGPVSVLLILTIILPASCAARQAITRSTEARVEQRIQQFRLWRMQVREVTEFDWRRMEESPDTASQAVAILKTLRFENHVDDAEIWRAATVLGRDEELTVVMRELTDEVVGGLAPDRAPRMSDIREAAVRWDVESRQWRSYAQFAALSEVTGTYYHELGRLFDELESHDDTGRSAKLVDYREHYAAQGSVLRNHLNAVASTWTDNWAAYRVPHPEAFLGRTQAPLYEVLRAPFIQTESQSFAPGQLYELATLPLQRLQAMAQGSPGCEGGETTFRRAPGCQCQNYEDERSDYFRLDCYSYMPRPQGTGAELRIEMRLVYKIPSRFASTSVPEEVFFHFLLPEGSDDAAFSAQVMTELAGAARQFLTEGRVRSRDRGGSAAAGFVIERGRTAFDVRSTVVPLTGLEPESRAVLVRVVKRG